MLHYWNVRHPSCPCVVTADAEGTIAVWDVNALKLVQVLLRMRACQAVMMVITTTMNIITSGAAATPACEKLETTAIEFVHSDVGKHCRPPVGGVRTLRIFEFDQLHMLLHAAPIPSTCVLQSLNETFFHSGKRQTWMPCLENCSAALQTSARLKLRPFARQNAEILWDHQQDTAVQLREWRHLLGTCFGHQNETNMSTSAGVIALVPLPVSSWVFNVQQGIHHNSRHTC